jgi:hypothetical protein
LLLFSLFVAIIAIEPFVNLLRSTPETIDTGTFFAVSVAPVFGPGISVESGDFSQHAPSAV